MLLNAATRWSEWLVEEKWSFRGDNFAATSYSDISIAVDVFVLCRLEEWHNLRPF